MKEVKFHGPVKSASGKMSGDSNMMFVTHKKTEKTSTRVIGKRDMEKHPVTEREQETQVKMSEVVAEYKRIKDNPEAFEQLKREYEQASEEMKGNSVYHYFLKTRMNEGKNSVTRKIARKGSNVDSYVEGMKKCQSVEEADRLLLDFVETLGYKELGEAYRGVRG